jgi:uncharacterized membrane protein
LFGDFPLEIPAASVHLFSNLVSHVPIFGDSIFDASDDIEISVFHFAPSLVSGETHSMDWHPLVIHFPIALWPVGFLVDLAAWARRREEWHGFAYLLQALATVGMLVAVLTGNAAAVVYRDDGRVADLIQRHEDLATLALLIFLVTVLGRLPLHLQGRLGDWKLKGWILAAGLGAVLMGTTAHLGGELVYERGVGVKVESATNEGQGENDDAGNSD